MSKKYTNVQVRISGISPSLSSEHGTNKSHPPSSTSTTHPRKLSPRHTTMPFPPREPWPYNSFSAPEPLPSYSYRSGDANSLTTTLPPYNFYNVDLNTTRSNEDNHNAESTITHPRSKIRTLNLKRNATMTGTLLFFGLIIASHILQLYLIIAYDVAMPFEAKIPNVLLQVLFWICWIPFFRLLEVVPRVLGYLHGTCETKRQIAQLADADLESNSAKEQDDVVDRMIEKARMSGWGKLRYLT